MGRKGIADNPPAAPPISAGAGKPSALLDTRVIYRVPSPGTPGEGRVGACLEQLARLPAGCVDLNRGGIDPPFNSNRNYEVFWGETKAPPARAFEDRHARGFDIKEGLQWRGK